MKLITLFFSLTLLPISGTQAQMSEEIAQQMAAQLKIQLKAQLGVMRGPELIEMQAKHLKTLFNALVKEGFSKDEALTLVVAIASNVAK